LYRIDTSATLDEDLHLNVSVFSVVTRVLVDIQTFRKDILLPSSGLSFIDTSATLNEDLHVNVSVFWVVTLSVLVDRYRRFERTSCFHLQG
jgi:hypothetical protein